MKFITERKELAQAINFGRYPVLYIDLADADDYGLKGCRVRIDAGTFRSGDPYIIDAILRVYSDEKKLTTASYGSCLHADFSYHDYKEMVDNAFSPLIHQDEDVVIAVYHSLEHICCAAILVHTASRVNPGCSEPLTFEDVDMTPYLDLANLYKK